jgi:hypothetical protein
MTMKNSMKFLLAIAGAVAAALALPALALAQPAATKEGAKASSKPAPAKPKPKPSASRVEIKSTAKQMAAGITAAEAALTPAQLAIADRVHVGRLPCELGNSVTLNQDPKSPGHFDLTTRNLKYRLAPVETSTGAIRLEDQKAGAVWLQLANKSMLMNHKLGQRLADECMSPTQAAFAETMKTSPPPSVLDKPAPAAPATEPAASQPAPAEASAVPTAAATPASAASAAQ